MYEHKVININHIMRELFRRHAFITNLSAVRPEKFKLLFFEILANSK